MGARGEPTSSVSWRPGLLTLRLSPENTLRFDDEGRWYSAQAGAWSWRRGLNGDVMVQPRTRPGESPISPLATRRRLSPLEADARTLEIHHDAAQAWSLFEKGELPIWPESSPEAIRRTLARLSDWTLERYHAEQARFCAVHGAVPVLPPDHYQALYLQLVRGCTYNRCRFCTLYQDVAAEQTSDEAWERHLEQVLELVGGALPLRRGVFLGDASALSLPRDVLLRRLHALPSRLAGLPSANRIGAFADTFSTPFQTVDDYRALAECGVQRLYIGLESGLVELRHRMRKPDTLARVLTRIQTLKQAGIGVGLMVIVGLGGLSLGQAHVNATLEFLSACGLDREDLVFLSRLEVSEESAFLAQMAQLGVPNSAALDQETQRFREGLAGTVRISDYTLAGFVY